MIRLPDKRTASYESKINNNLFVSVCPKYHIGYTYAIYIFTVYMNFKFLFLFAKSGNPTRTHLQVLILGNPETYTFATSKRSSWGSPGQIHGPCHVLSVSKET